MTKTNEPRNPSKLYEVAGKVKIALLTTVEENGSLHTRPMANSDIDEEGNVWFFTSKEASAANNIASNSQVSIAYSNPDEEQYVVLAGKAFLISDKETIRSKWTDALRTWFPEGEEDPDIVLIKVHPVEGQLWDNPSATLANIIGYVRDHFSDQQARAVLEQAKVHL